MTASIANAVMRALSLVARFGLSIYLVRILGYSALGYFGILSGIAGVLPWVLGFGVSYHLNRELIGGTRARGYRLLRDRMAMSLAMVLLAWLIGTAAAAAGAIPSPAQWLLPGLIVSMELIAFDLHIGLINLRRPVAANLLLFVRSASWIGPLVLIGLAWPQSRGMATLLVLWCGALVVNFVLFLIVVRDAPFGTLRRAPVDIAGLVEKARRTPLIYANDLAAAGQTYLDRFIVAQLLGIAAAGVYTLCFSVAQGLYVVVAAGVTQLSMPKLMAALTDDGPTAWLARWRSERRRVAVAVLPLTLGLLGFALVILPILGFQSFVHNAAVFVLMIAAAMLKPFADLANTALYSLAADRVLAMTNLVGIAVSLILGIACIAMLGLVGIGVSSVATQLLLIGVRTRFAQRLASTVRA